MQSKETAGGCFGGRVRVGERESEPSVSRNPLHEKKEALRCFFFAFIRIRGSKRPLRSKETAGGCFSGRLRVGERESEPSESCNPLHEKEEALRCFFFAFIRIARLEKAVAKQRNCRGAVSAAVCASASAKASRASLVIRSTRKKERRCRSFLISTCSHFRLF